jgi:hypothetical protein
MLEQLLDADALMASLCFESCDDIFDDLDLEAQAESPEPAALPPQLRTQGSIKKIHFGRKRFGNIFILKFLDNCTPKATHINLSGYYGQ